MKVIDIVRDRTKIAKFNYFCGGNLYYTVEYDGDINLVSIEGASKLAVVKLVRELTSLGLREAKDLVESAPCKIREKVSESEANEVKKQFEDIGVKMEVK